MRTFMVALKESTNADPKELIGRLDEERFPETYNFIAGKAWFVAVRSTMTTPDDAADVLLKSTNDPEDLTFVVAEVGDYQGFADQGLWQKLEAWEFGG